MLNAKFLPFQKIKMKYFLFVFLLISLDTYAHQLEGDVPCYVSTISGTNIINFGFATHTSMDSNILNLEDGDIYIGIEMIIEGDSLSFTRKFNVLYQKKGNQILGGGTWDRMTLTDSNKEKLGQFPNVTCKSLGASNKN